MCCGKSFDIVFLFLVFWPYSGMFRTICAMHTLFHTRFTPYTHYIWTLFGSTMHAYYRFRKAIYYHHLIQYMNKAFIHSFEENENCAYTHRKRGKEHSDKPNQKRTTITIIKKTPAPHTYFIRYIRFHCLNKNRQLCTFTPINSFSSFELQMCMCVYCTLYSTVYILPPSLSFIKHQPK